jgi:ABC-2 type transport system permease protein
MKKNNMLENIFAVFKREIKSYFSSPVAYVFIVIFLLLSGFFTFYVGNFFEAGQADLSRFFQWHPWLFIFLIPSVSMGLWAEEKRLGTIEVLLTFPISLAELIIGKFLSAWIFIGISLFLTFPIIITVSYLGNPDMGAIFCGYAGSFFMAGAFLSLGLMTSALTQSQVISFILSASASLLFVLTGYSPFTSIFSGWSPLWLERLVLNFSFLSHFYSMARGVIDIRDIIYYFSMIFFMLFLNHAILYNRRGA